MKKDVSRREGRSRKRIVLVVLGAVGAAAAVTGGIALANWTAGGTGSGSAKAVTAQNLTITAAAAPAADLYPGFSGAIQFTVTNPNPYPVSLNGWSTGTVTSGDPTNCPVAGNVSAVASGTLSSPIAVAAGATSSAQSIPASITMSNTAANGCQGVTFTVALTLTGTQT